MATVPWMNSIDARPVSLAAVVLALVLASCGQRLVPSAVVDDPEPPAGIASEAPAAQPPEPDGLAPSVAPSADRPATAATPQAGREPGWVAIPSPPFPAAFSHTAWTGEELLLVGGGRANGGLHRLSAAYDPATMTWRSIAAAPHDLWAYWGDAHWTGRELLVFGLDASSGDPGSSPRLAYDPAADRWRQLPAAPLNDVTSTTTAWTGEELLVLATPRSGGAPVGAAYDPEQVSWRTIAPFPLDGDRFHPMIIWTDGELVVWAGSSAEASPAVGGQEPPPPARGGAAYDPATDTWRVLAVADEAMGLHPVAWTGREILCLDGDEPIATYAITADLARVRRVADAPRRAVRTHEPVWTGQELVLIGDRSDPRAIAGAAYDPATDRWHELPDPGMEAERVPVVTWAGSELIVVGGRATVEMETERDAGDAFSYRPPARNG